MGSLAEKNSLTADDVNAISKTKVGNLKESDNFELNTGSGMYGYLKDDGTANLLINFYAGSTLSCRNLQLWCGYRNSFLRFRTSRDNYGFEKGWVDILGGHNTTVDSNGFIKKSSPVVKVFSDGKYE